MQTKQRILFLIGLLCCFLIGCKKVNASEANTNPEAADANVCETKESPEDADPSQGEAGASQKAADTSQETADATDSISTDSSEKAVNPESSWKQIKEIKPADKGMTSRLVGFYNDSFGISTARYGRVFYTVDGGETWVSGKNYSACIAGVEMIDESNAFITANNSQVRLTKDGAANWDKVPNFGNMDNEHCRYLSFIDENTGWIANKKEIGFTTDGGQSWTSINVPANLSVISAIWLNSAEEGYILDDKGIMFTTGDGGATWTEKDLKLQGLQIVVCPTAAFHITDSNHFQLVVLQKNATECSYYYYSTSDGGATWDKQEQILNDKFGYIHLNREGTLLTYTDGTDCQITVYQLKQ